MCMKWLLLKLKKNLYSLAPWNKSYEKPRKCIKKKKKQRHYFAYKGLYGQSYGFPSSHIQM